jgi:hypothetical protein
MPTKRTRCLTDPGLQERIVKAIDGGAFYNAWRLEDKREVLVLEGRLFVWSPSSPRVLEVAIDDVTSPKEILRRIDAGEGTV